jgi:TRAP-type C4-dicarboxylate transport system substrate-binding protein
MGRLYPDAELYSLPLTFRSYAEVDYVRERLDPEIVKGLKGSGLEVLAIGDGGFAYLMSQRPMRRVDDLSGARVWIQEDDIMSETAFKTAGISPIQIPLADVYTALQTGLIDTVAAPAIATIAFQWHTRVKYLTDVPLMYLVGVLALDQKAWKKISKVDQAIVREVVAETTQRLDASNREGESQAREALREQGIEFVAAASDAEVERWHQISRQVTEQLRKSGRYQTATIDAIERYLAEFRAQSGQGD